MRFDDFEEPLRTAVLSGLSFQLGRLAQTGGPDSGGAFSLHESCRVLLLDLPAEIPDDQPIESFARRLRMWHHQIWRDGQPEYFARSIIHDAGPGQPPIRLCKVARSVLAKQFDATLAFLDTPEMADRIHQPPGADWKVRLLIASRFDFHAFAFVENERIQEVVPLLTSPAAEAPAVVNRESLRSEILRHSVAFGIR